jgi:hypothetical protein
MNYLSNITSGVARGMRNLSSNGHTSKQHSADVTAARGLGWASIAIGLTEMLMPKQVEQWLGVGNGKNTAILRVLGAREIAQGIDILSHDDPTPGVWARVAGDALDSVVLGIAGRKTRNPGGYATITAMVMAIGALDLIFAKRLSSYDD